MPADLQTLRDLRERVQTATGAKRVLVCGGRDFSDGRRVREMLDWLPDVECIIEGGARGADMLAAGWAQAASGVRLETYPADWKNHGRAAGPIRNRQMLAEGHPDLVIAFPGGRGTADMVEQAKAAGVPVIEVPALIARHEVSDAARAEGARESADAVDEIMAGSIAFYGSNSAYDLAAGEALKLVRDRIRHAPPIRQRPNRRTVMLHSHRTVEEPLMSEVVQSINNTLFEAQERGLSLSGGLNCLMHAVTLTLVSAYSDNKTRMEVASSLPDVVRAYVPQWEKILATATNGARGRS